LPLLSDIDIQFHMIRDGQPAPPTNPNHTSQFYTFFSTSCLNLLKEAGIIEQNAYALTALKQLVECKKPVIDTFFKKKTLKAQDFIKEL